MLSSSLRTASFTTLIDIERLASFSANSALLIQAAYCALINGHGERYDVRLWRPKLWRGNFRNGGAVEVTPISACFTVDS